MTDIHIHASPYKYGVTTLQNSFFPLEILTLKPISADDLALFGDEVKSAEARGNQINFSLVLVT